MFGLCKKKSNQTGPDFAVMWGGHQKWFVPSWVEFPLYMITIFENVFVMQHF